MKDKFTPGQKVELTIIRKTDLGFVAKINGAEEGLLYKNEVFQPLNRGLTLPGYIKEIREDGKIDLILQPFGNFGAEQIALKIIERLEENNGTLKINDKTPPEKIYEIFGVSKKKYKIALGMLYKKRLISITDEEIKLNN